MTTFNIFFGLLLLVSSLSFAQTTSRIVEGTNTRGFWGAENRLTNPDWEQRTTGWTASGGTYTRTTTASQVGRGIGAGSWDSSAAAQTLSSNTISLVTSGFTNKNVTFSCLIKAATGTATHKLQIYDGTNVLGDGGAITSSTSEWVRAFVTAPAGSTGTILARVISVASNEPQIFLDDCYFGASLGFNVANVSQATFFGSLRYVGASSCGWSITQTTYAADFSADTDCSTPTVVGNLAAPATKLPGFDATFPPGEYLIIATGFAATFSSNQPSFALFDGSTQIASSYGPGTSNASMTVSGHLSVTSGAAKTIRVRALSAAGSATITNDVSSSELRFMVYRFPATTEAIFRPDQIANSWAGYHDSTCSFARTNTAFGAFTADASCAFTERVNNNFGTVASALSGSDKLPGITFTPTRASTYLVCAGWGALNSTTGNNVWRLQASGGSTDEVFEAEQAVSAGEAGARRSMARCGLLKIPSTTATTVTLEGKSASGDITISGAGTAVEWSIIQIDQKLPMPVFSQSVVSDSSGVEKVCRATSEPSCASSPCAITRQSGCVSSITRASAGVYTVNFVASSFSAAPTCLVQSNQAQTSISATTTTSSFDIATTNSTGTASDGANISIFCMGAK